MSTVSTPPSIPALSGQTFLAGTTVSGAGASFHGHDPVRNLTLDPVFVESSLDQVDDACRAAAASFDNFRSQPLELRAALLDEIAAEILSLGDALLQRANQETGLPLARLQGERTRTISQLQMFATVVRNGDLVGTVHDAALPERQPLPRPELLLKRIPTGPVAVFGASNFPLAFSVAGGDSASALAAGCPIVVKAHPSHPGTSELVAGAVQRAIAKCGLPLGIFSMVHGAGHDVGGALATHPAIQAVAFTGSRKGGMALMQLASTRHDPIPVFAEMSSVNPVFVFPAAMAGRATEIAIAYVDSLTLGTGQFCTQPGLLFAQDGPALDSLLASAAGALQAKPSSPLLNHGIHAAYGQAVQTLQQIEALTLVAEGEAPEDDGLRGRPALFRTSYRTYREQTQLQDEIFGPCSLVVICADKDEMLHAAETLEGQLTATLQVDAADYEEAAPFVPVLERKAGRLLVNGFPTGVEVGYAMVHGGPFPATSDSRFTSVGMQAIHRFLRPVCYQNFPAQLMPRTALR